MNTNESMHGEMGPVWQNPIQAGKLIPDIVESDVSSQPGSLLTNTCMLTA